MRRALAHPHCDRLGSDVLLTATDLKKVYVSGEARITALDGVSLELDTGDFVAIMGPSGCGKSTLLHLCGAMDRPSSGHVVFEGRALAVLSDDELTRVRRDRVGFVFQFFNLLPTLTLGDNIMLPCLLSGMATANAEVRARRLADLVGIGHRWQHFPQQVSGGEMQRAAIARALVHGPALVVADEPTGNLDSENGSRVMSLLQDLNRNLGVTILLATHSADVAAGAKRIQRMRDGRLAGCSLAIQNARSQEMVEER
jgi:ABC-type lipoprotein export system ATPase subunit